MRKTTTKTKTTERDRQLAEFCRLAGTPKRIRVGQVTIATEVVEFPICTVAKGLTPEQRRNLTNAGWRFWWWKSHNNLRRGWAKLLQVPMHAKPLSYWWRNTVEGVGLIMRLDSWALTPCETFCGKYPQHCDVGGALLTAAFQIKKHTQVRTTDVPWALSLLLLAVTRLANGDCAGAADMAAASELVQPSDGINYVLRSKRPTKIRSPYTDPVGFFEDAAKLERRLVKAGA